LRSLQENSARFCGGGEGLSWAVEPRKERKKERMNVLFRRNFVGDSVPLNINLISTFLSDFTGRV
jgi:hypothetical protein